MEPFKVFFEKFLEEMPVKQLKTVGFDKDEKTGKVKGRSFNDPRDRDLLTNPNTLRKIEDFFENTDYDFNLYFVNKPGLRQFSETGKVNKEFVQNSLGLDPNEFEEDAINVIFVSNVAGEKVPMTPWTVAHRIGHAIRREYHFQELTKWLEKRFEELLGMYGMKSFSTYDYGISSNTLLSKAKANLFNQIGTMRSARQNKIKRYFEFYYELLAQYLNRGEIKFNKLGREILVGHEAYGRKKHAYTKDPEEVNEYLEILERDFGFLVQDALGSIVNDIFVM